ncbi:MAG: altronate dehydratase [bacterium]|nr:altronate dehydratase [bacterium]
MKKYIKITSKDNVAIALKNLDKGSIIDIDDHKITLLDYIPQGHKIAITDILKDEGVIKYSLSIGTAIENISIGSHIHVHNIKTCLGDIKEYSFTPKYSEVSINIPEKNINAYRRKNGSVGIRNEIWIVPTVGCVNAMGNQMIQKFTKEFNTEEVDGVYIFPHNYGCSQMGDDHENTVKILRDITLHPNAGGVLILGLGCENNQVKDFVKTLGSYDKKRIRTLIIQNVEDEVKEGSRILNEIYEIVKNDRRETMSISNLKIGLKCGGSDGLSGITANPLLGAFSDYLTYYDGTTVLTEVPEMFGAETILMNRAKDVKTFDKIVKIINDFKNYFKSHNQVIYENPSPGNKKGGITTLEDKSLGCTQKAGNSKVIDVINYGDVLEKNGLNLLNGPGNDMVAATALGASGCHMVLFTTGRGTPYGSFIPTVKISTNSELYSRKPNWMDFNAGSLVEDKNMNDVLKEFIELIIKIADGEKVKNEINNFREIAILKTGVTL